MDLDLDNGNVAMWQVHRCDQEPSQVRAACQRAPVSAGRGPTFKLLLDDAMIDNDPLQDRKNHESMQGLIESLQQKIKTYKKQIEEAEEIAALNLAKFRQVGPTKSFSIFFYTKDCKLSTRSKQHWEQASKGLI